MSINYTVATSAHLATVRPGTSCWAVLEAEYDVLHAEVVTPSAEKQGEEADHNTACGYLRLVERETNIRIGGYNRRAGKNSKVKGQYRPWQQR